MGGLADRCFRNESIGQRRVQTVLRGSLLLEGKPGRLPGILPPSLPRTSAGKGAAPSVLCLPARKTGLRRSKSHRQGFPESPPRARPGDGCRGPTQSWHRQREGQTSCFRGLIFNLPSGAELGLCNTFGPSADLRGTDHHPV